MKYSEEYVREIVNKSICVADCLKYLKLDKSGGNYRIINKYIQKYKIDISHFDIKKAQQKANYPGYKGFALEDILSNKIYASTKSLKKKLYDNEIKQRICEFCGQNENWMGKKFALILDHIDGNNKNNSLTNLRILCPNCNATLDTHCGKNKKKIFKEVRKCKLCDNPAKKNRSHCQNCIDKNINYYRQLILDSDIDFSKFGWVNKAAIVLDKHPAKVNHWIKTNMLLFYEEKCFKKKIE